MKFTSPKQLKDWLKNKEISEGIPSNTLLNYYMMERFLERISISKYNDNFIFKGGFLISSMIGINLRSTLDIDATLKGIPISEEKVIEIINNIISIELDDNMFFNVIKIKSIHSSGKYEDFRITIEAKFFNVKEFLKIDLTTGDVIIPKEIEYSYNLMFGERTINIRAYHLYTILAEKIETALSRNIANTRAKDFYDIYVLTNFNKEKIDKEKFIVALKEKCIERDTIIYLESYKKYIDLIRNSSELKEIWTNYQNKNKYAEEISWAEIISSLEYLLNDDIISKL